MGLARPPNDYAIQLRGLGVQCVKRTLYGNPRQLQLLFRRSPT